MFITVPNDKLRKICVENDWFTAGDNEQYSKLFELNTTGGITFESIVAIIYVCSERYSIKEIDNILWKAHTEFIESIQESL